MELKKFVSKRGSVSSLASKINVPVSLISDWANMHRPVPIERCARLEAATDGLVMRWDLRPNDWWQIWPELIAHPDAPPIPAELQVANAFKAFSLDFSSQPKAVRGVNHG